MYLSILKTRQPDRFVGLWPPQPDHCNKTKMAAQKNYCSYWARTNQWVASLWLFTWELVLTRQRVCCNLWLICIVLPRLTSSRPQRVEVSLNGEGKWSRLNDSANWLANREKKRSLEMEMKMRKGTALFQMPVGCFLNSVCEFCYLFLHF